MENKDYLENICNMISEIARIAKELLCDIHKQISQSIIAIATIAHEIMLEMPNITSNNFLELSRLLSAIPKDTCIFDDQYEKKLSQDNLCKLAMEESIAKQVLNTMVK